MEVILYKQKYFTVLVMLVINKIHVTSIVVVIPSDIWQIKYSAVFRGTYDRMAAL